MNSPFNFTLLLLALLLPANAVANNTYDFFVDGIYYDIIGNEAEVTCKYLSVNKYGMFTIRSNYCGNVVIPSTVTYNDTTYLVTSIGIDAFYDCDSLTSVTIPNSVTSIGSEAFRNCNNLTSVTIPNSVISIGHDAFYGTPWFDHQPDGLVYAGQVAYKYKGTMPEGTSITIKEGTLGIAESAFSHYRGLTNVTIPNSVVSISDWAFSGCRGLTSVTIPNSVTSIGWAAFSGCSDLTSVTIGNSVTTISDWVFYDCNSLTSVTIPNSVVSIGFDVFHGTPWFDHQPDGLVYAGQVAYKYKGTMSEGASITLREGTLSIADGALEDCRYLESVTIPNSVTHIGNRAFRGCSALSSVSIPNSVTSIGWGAFYDCSSLKNITIPDSVTSIDDQTFSGCSGLSSVTIPNSVTSIGWGAFYNCSSLTSVKLSDSIVDIDRSAFSGCPNISKVVLLNPTPPSCVNTTTFDNNVYNEAKLYVPKESVDLFNASDNWGKFIHIIGVNTSN